MVKDTSGLKLGLKLAEISDELIQDWEWKLRTHNDDIDAAIRGGYSSCVQQKLNSNEAFLLLDINNLYG